ncbi:hypothetical protein MW695_16100 [Alkalihalobacillus sp. APA_J-10(15)]|nr:hypothetical protein [Halalkalibacter sp. APA_J-10(15)]MCK0472884.1 hypothetical protein [Halalkalibacter sp. APA_J-10(15)]
MKLVLSLAALRKMGFLRFRPLGGWWGMFFFHNALKYYQNKKTFLVLSNSKRYIHGHVSIVHYDNLDHAVHLL